VAARPLVAPDRAPRTAAVADTTAIRLAPDTAALVVETDLVRRVAAGTAGSVGSDSAAPRTLAPCISAAADTTAADDLGRRVAADTAAPVVGTGSAARCVAADTESRTADTTAPRLPVAATPRPKATPVP